MTVKRLTYLSIGLLIACFVGLWVFKKFNVNPTYAVGQQIKRNRE